jgi:transcriptional regulator with XRE-family HTH domain
MPRVNSRNPETDPAAFLGEQLRRVRLAAGYKIQDSFAAAAYVSQDTVSKAETGYQPPTDDMLDLWMKLCHVAGSELDWFKGAIKLARNFRGLLVEGFDPWLAIERQASFLRAWNPLLVPGLLQMEEYALALFRAMGKSSEKTTQLLALRLDRQGVLSGPDPVTGVFLIEESVLDRLVHSSAVMVEQLDCLLAASDRPNVTIQIVQGSASLAGMFGALEIASGDDIPDTALMWAVQDHATTDSALVREGIMMFELIRGRALNVEESRTLLLKARQQWESQQ